MTIKRRGVFRRTHEILGIALARHLLTTLQSQGSPKRSHDSARSPISFDATLSTKFFSRCGFPFVHDGSTRKWWALERLKELNGGRSQSVDLPSDDIMTVLDELFDVDDFDRATLSRDAGLETLNKVLAKQSLVGYFSTDGRFHVRNTGTGQSVAGHAQDHRPLSAEEIAQRQQVAAFLEAASEDEFTESLLVPFFQRMGFRRVSALGHKEKTLEYGKDLWMKFQLPTGHWLYFGAQIKREKLDARGG